MCVRLVPGVLLVLAACVREAPAGVNEPCGPELAPCDEPLDCIEVFAPESLSLCLIPCTRELDCPTSPGMWWCDEELGYCDGPEYRR